jgi:predicted O-methyltransferase YrrM
MNILKVLKQLFRSDPDTTKSSLLTSTYLDIEELSLAIEKVPGMITPQAGKRLFELAASQTLSGDIVEIGSWQGKSTLYLAHSLVVNPTGKLYAIDHFKGNPGKEALYQAQQKDLSDLKSIFESNMRRFNVDKKITLLNMPSSQASRTLTKKKIQIRLLFIDGCHEYAGVKQDFVQFYDLILPGGIIVFDDFSHNFAGVLAYIDEAIEAGLINRFYAGHNTFIAQKPL